MADPTPRVTTVACLGGLSFERGVTPEEVEEYLQDPATLVWMDVQDPGPAELTTLHELFGFHTLALEDVSKGGQRPKVDEYKDHQFVVTYGVALIEDVRALRPAEVDLFIGRNFVVSVHRGQLPAMDDARARWSRGGALLREGVGFLVYAITDAIVDSYFPVLDAIENEVDQTELALATRFDEQKTMELLRLKHTLASLRRVLLPMRETFHVFLRRERSFFSANTLVYFHDVNDHILRILDALEIERDRVGSALEAYLTVSSNRLNQTMRTLAVVTVAIGVVSSVFGAWGMNFEKVPLSDHPWGFLAVAGGTVVLILIFILALRKLGRF